MNKDIIITIAVITIAAVFMFARLIRLFRSKKTPCDCCGACSSGRSAGMKKVKENSEKGLPHGCSVN
ncbi:MAG: hypothetical protein LBV68_03025 [Spirochaetaceae bacterium]|jgi:hypothetical protein|nr:hypothetical protein [Spirochaetaceae bacterium]